MNVYKFKMALPGFLVHVIVSVEFFSHRLIDRYYIALDIVLLTSNRNAKYMSNYLNGLAFFVSKIYLILFFCYVNKNLFCYHYKKSLCQEL